MDNGVSSISQFDSEQPMSDTDSKSVDGTVEECVDEIDDFVTTLERYPETVLAVALRVHLGSLLHALLERGVTTADQVREFLLELEHEVLQPPT
jgi:nitrate/nitrite-specific signal transduction histidine kinase